MLQVVKPKVTVNFIPLLPNDLEPKECMDGFYHPKESFKHYGSGDTIILLCPICNQIWVFKKDKWVKMNKIEIRKEEK